MLARRERENGFSGEGSACKVGNLTLRKKISDLIVMCHLRKGGVAGAANACVLGATPVSLLKFVFGCMPGEFACLLKLVFWGRPR